MTNPFDWAYLTTVPHGWEVYGPLAIAYVVVNVLGLVGSLLLGQILGRRYRNHALNRRVARMGTQAAAWLFGVGLLTFLPRAMELPFLGMRLWLYLQVLVTVAAAGYGVWWMLARYPDELRRYQQQEAKRQYLRPPPQARLRRSSGARRRR